MRKIFWWGAAGLLASAGAAYLAASYPGVNCAALMCQGVVPAAEHSSLGAGLGALVSNLDRGVKSVTDLDSLCPAQSCKLMAEPAAEECPEVPGLVPAAVEASEPIQIQMSELQAPCAEEEIRQTGGVGGVPGAGPADGDPTATSDSALGYTGEESDASILTPPEPQVCTPDDDIVMPKIEEADAGEGQAMPYVEEDTDKDDTAIPFSAWIYWLKKQGAKTGTPQKETDLVPGEAPKPAIPGGEAAPETTSPSAVPVPDALSPMDVAVPPGYPVPQGTSPADASGAPNCQEDPHYHHQYPGCPYTGGCPYSGATSYPTMKDFAPPKIEKNKKRKKKEIKAEPTSMLKKLSESLLEDLKNNQFPKRCGIDTMECRPTDARLPVAELKDRPF